MNMEFERSYAELLNSDEPLPQELSLTYEVLACLKESPGKKTYLLRDKAEREKYILKLAAKEEAGHLLEEGKILQKIQKTEEQSKATENDMLYVKALFEKEGTVYLLRNYVEGRSLAETGKQRHRSSTDLDSLMNGRIFMVSAEPCCI